MCKNIKVDVNDVFNEPNCITLEKGKKKVKFLEMRTTCTRRLLAIPALSYERGNKYFSSLFARWYNVFLKPLLTLRGTLYSIDNLLNGYHLSLNYR